VVSDVVHMGLSDHDMIFCNRKKKDIQNYQPPFLLNHSKILVPLISVKIFGKVLQRSHRVSSKTSPWITEELRSAKIGFYYGIMWYKMVQKIWNQINT